MSAHRKARQTVAPQKKARPPGPKDDLKRLVQELEIHQLELEMQNEELRQTQNKLEASLNAYAGLYDFAPVGYFSVTPQGLIQTVNLTGAQLLDAERLRLIGTPMSLWIPTTHDRKIFLKHCEEAYTARGSHACELQLRKKNGTTFDAQLQSTATDMVDGQTGSIRITVFDMTERKQMQNAMQKAYEELDRKVAERTRELTLANELLVQEIGVRKEAEDSLRLALREIKLLKDRLLAENVYLQQEVARASNFGEIIGKGRAISRVFAKIDMVAPQDTTVLLLGETGSGKGVVARAIHARSSRKDRPMVTVNCTALPANLIESELFGREKGAFTGAAARQMGRFELADGGTIFLDEIGEMPVDLQCKLLRVIQDGEFERLGSPRTIKVDVRIIAASNRNLEEEIKKGNFREDLYYRLNVFPITIPPLRSRKEDIQLLVNFFVAKFNKKIGKQIQTIPLESLDILQEYSWPGNVRELESVVERAVISSRGSALHVEDRFSPLPKPNDASLQDIKSLPDMERDYILRVLQKTNWRIEGKNGAAVILDMNPSTLRARMRKFGIHRNYI
ncbi:sigma 54-interacting transcriptional regulator [Desulfovibrio psychrotolerans]|uniref:Fis family transcriptional regulator n=1 Tax=Desulfovibrio psychrotolerans TaxID=415242 RepID=A0A7J0BYI7_9BACT|nr:sigma 54-interacting transcriptional regulator [Desulfovibrio psychrotolerans]GFM38221.1 hypothetical protein DSM19430T_29050 [Desulfovibrio psychrotolerans]